ncbi:ROK family protein [Aurantiacibacter poecillastricola]|uniref:ROK family protein n=1 Tax=Aurantiacibacter poecillastricola TaxID=3064385 RepID=UPI00273D3457|nr:ROK family protein [Aurantiacibacter sp. 219JJ12-13]MDP5263033.1 ROK family protein [Aurantiacibacter sp. 219JJ12-13]
MNPGASNRLAGIELGGTKCIVVLGEGEQITARESLATTSPAETLRQVMATLEAWHDAAPLQAIGIASFGPIRVNPSAADYGTILDTPKPGWSGTPVLELVREKLSCPIGIDTDVNAAMLAEQKYGAARGLSNAVYITIGTGLGGGVLIGEQPAHGLMHPEIGHLRLRRAPGDKFPGVCPFHGDCIEGLVAGPALHARLPVPPAELEPTAKEWDAVAHDLAELIAHLMLTLSPERIVIGGGVMSRQPHLFDRARKIVPHLLSDYLGPVERLRLEDLVCPPGLGNDSGPVGALVLAARAVD